MSHSIEKVKPKVEVTTMAVPPNLHSNPPLSPIAKYKMLVGDVDKPLDPHDDSLYHEIQINERKAFRIWLLTSFCFGFLVLAQVVLCLGIAVGATAADQNKISRVTISILAGTNTAVAALIGILKSLGLPDKKGVERRKWQKLAEHIRYTSRRLKAGLKVDVEKDVDDVTKTFNADADEEAALLAADKLGDAAGAQKGDSK